MSKTGKPAKQTRTSEHKASRTGLLVMLVVVTIAATIWKLSSTQTASAARTPSPSLADTPTSPMVAATPPAAEDVPAKSLFAPTIPNKITPPGKAPVGMVWIPGGEFSMGAQDPP